MRVAQGQFGVEETDGIDLSLRDAGTNFPGRLMVVQDGHNAPRAQNFKLVAWDDVIAALQVQK